MLALWDATGTEVVKKLAAERRNAGGVASGLALTVIVVVDASRIRQVEDAATIAAAAHPCRFLIVSRGPVPGPDAATVSTRNRLDAEIMVGGRLGPCEAVIMQMHGRLALHAESVVIPLLAPDVPVMTWWHGPPPASLAFDPLGVVAERRITDVAQTADPAQGLLQRAIDYAPGDTDLAWTRLTGWRSLIAGAFDTGNRDITSATVTGPLGDPGSSLLIGWLRARLGCEVSLNPAPTLSTVDVRLSGSERVSLQDNGDGTAVLRRSGVNDRLLPLVRRKLGDELAEEMRRLDPDQPYGAALSAASGVDGLNDRPATRTHIWQDPVLAGAA